MANKRRRLFNYFTVLMLIFIGGLIAYLFWNKISYFFNEDRESNFTMYPGFGIQLPDGYAIHGIDVSRYQKRINWPLVRQMKEMDIKLGFAFIKATEGTTLTDPEFKRNWRKAKDNHVTRGAYHYFISYRDGKEQAEHFINVVTLLPGDLPPVLDIETLNGASATTMRQNLAEWLKMIEDHYKVKPIIYSNASFYNNYLDGKFSGYRFWVAHYLARHQPEVNRTWSFWQHNESGRVNGIDGFVDFNVFNGDSADFKALLLK